MATSDARGRSWRLPRWATGVLAVVTALTIVVAGSTTWLHNTTLDTDKFVDRVGPIVEDDAVSEALGTYAASQLVMVVDVEGFFDDVLPERGRILAPVLTNAIEGFLAEEATKFFASDTFDELWTIALERAHEAAVRVLRGESEVVQTVDGKVVLNLVPILNTILANVEGRISGLVGRDVNLPEIAPGELPSEAVQKLQNALGTNVTIPDDFGQIEVFDSGSLDTLQLAVEWFDRGMVILWILAVALLALTLGAANDRRLALMYTAIGAAVFTVVARRMVFTTQATIVDKIKVEENRAAADAIISQIFDSYLAGTVTFFVIAVLIALGAYVFGPSRWAVAVRGAIAKAGRATADAADDITWLREHAGALRIAVIVIAGGFVLFVPVSFWELLLIGVVVTALAVWLTVVQRGGATPGVTPEVQH